MIPSTTSASIAWDDQFGIQYRICRLDYTVLDEDNYEYVFTPDYRIIDILPMDTVGGIPGLDLDQRCERYIRRNMEPVFVTERSPSRNRADVWELMEQEGLDHYDRLEWLIRTDTRYAGDDLYVVRYETPGTFDFTDELKRDAREASASILSALGSGGRVIIEGEELIDPDISSVGRTLRYILGADDRANPDRPETPKVGRKKKEFGYQSMKLARECMKENR